MGIGDNVYNPINARVTGERHLAAAVTVHARVAKFLESCLNQFSKRLPRAFFPNFPDKNLNRISHV